MVTSPSSVSDNWEYTGLRVTASSRCKIGTRKITAKHDDT